MKTPAAAPRAAIHTRMLRRRVLLVAGAVLLWFAIATALPAAAPSYTDWPAPVNLGPIVNSAASETGPALSADGLSLYFASDRSGGLGLRDIWVSQRPTVSAAWGTPVHLEPPINTAFDDFVPAFTPDGHSMFFASTRPGGAGLADIYRSYRADIHNDFGWQTPINQGENINTASNDNGVGYFENGGAPQLFFGSGRLGGSHLFVSHRQAEDKWGPATLIEELFDSIGLDNRPSLREDGLEIIFYSNRPGGFGANDAWTATRASVDAPWSAPVNLGATVNGSAQEQHPYLTADGRTLFLYSSRAGGSGGNDLYVSTRDAKLTVTANNQARLFGQANPPLTYTISGFVGGETSAVVSGAAECTTTATTSSPAGPYPITCTVGTLSAPGYTFATFVPGTLTVGYTSPCLTGTRTGPLTVTAGQAVCIGAGGTQTGPVTIKPGGALDVEGGTITGPLTSTGAAAVRICGATITGPLTIKGSTGPVLVGGDTANGPCAPSTIVGPATLTGNSASVQLVGAHVTGPVQIKNNNGGTTVTGNTINGPLTVTGNTGTVVDTPNTVNGPSTLQ